MNRMQEIANVYPVLNRRYFRSSERSFVASLRRQADSTCRGYLPEDYVHRTFNKFKYGYAYSNPQTDELLGFCVWLPKQTPDLDESPIMYVALLCAKAPSIGVGRLMLFDLERYCIDNNYDYIHLVPARPELIPYYQSFGYTMQNDNKTMMKAMYAYTVRGSRSKTRRVTHKYKREFRYSENTGNHLEGED
jgi:hypothetical protein